jgi:hypothetical protein
MMERITSVAMVGLAVVTLVSACGERAAAPTLDGQPGFDFGIVDRGPTPDRGLMPDQASADYWPWQDFIPPQDVGPQDFTVPDGGWGKSCKAAISLTLSGGKAQASGQIDKADTDNNVTLPSISCVGATTSGADRFYKIALSAGKSYVVTVSGSASPEFHPAIYVFSSCANPAGTCIAGAGKKVTTQALTLKPKSSGTYTIGVDSTWPMGTMYAYGSYTLSVLETTGYETCTGALKLSWGSGTKISTAGDTTSASGDLDLGYSSCTGGKGTGGADLFYSVPVVSGKSYKITVTPTTNWNPALYVLSSCTNPSAACVAGADYGYNNQPESVIFTAKSSGAYVIGVDSSYVPGPVPYPYAAGPFLLTIEEFKPSGNDVCAKPTALSWSGTKATGSGDTSNASATLSMKSSCLPSSYGTPGKDLFYSVTTTKGKGYKVTVTPTATSGKPTWNPAVYVFTDCSNAAGSCVAGSNYMGYPSYGVETSFVASKTGSYLIGVDSTSSSSTYGHGPFTISVEEYTPPANDICSLPQALSWSGTKATITGDTTQAANSVNLSYTDCTKKTTQGTDLFYSVSVSAGKSYKVTVMPSMSWNPAVYVFTDCSNVGGSCVAGNDYSYTGQPESASFIASKTGTVLIGVDSNYPVGPKPGYGGSFTLTVEEFTPPTNSSCAKPQAMTWSGSKASVTGDTSLSSNEFTGIKCSGSAYFEGPQLYYKVALSAGKTYLVTLTPSVSFDGALYGFPAATACSAVAINPACYYTYSSQYGKGAPDTMKITPPTSGDWVIAVDSITPAYFGSFSLTVEAFTPPGNDSCAKAQALSFSSSGVATVSGTTTTASNSVTLSYPSCIPGTTSGNDLFYSVNLTAGKTYTIQLVPDKMFDPVLYLFTSCSNPTGTCVKGSAMKGFGYTETIIYAPPTTGTYLIAVDAFGYTTGGAGSFTLTVQ